MPNVISRWLGGIKPGSNTPENVPSGLEGLQGPHFRVGHTFYPGINPLMFAMHNKTSMGDSTISDGYIKMSPPVIPRSNVTIRGIYQGIGVSAEYYHDRARIPVINTPRR